MVLHIFKYVVAERVKGLSPLSAKVGIKWMFFTLQQKNAHLKWLVEGISRSADRYVLASTRSDECESFVT